VIADRPVVEPLLWPFARAPKFAAKKPGIRR